MRDATLIGVDDRTTKQIQNTHDKQLQQQLQLNYSLGKDIGFDIVFIYFNLDYLQL